MFTFSVNVNHPISFISRHAWVHFKWSFTSKEEDLRIIIFVTKNNGFYKSPTLPFRFSKQRFIKTLKKTNQWSYIEWSCKSLNPFPLYWSKTILITGGMGGTGQDPTCKLGRSFQIPLTLNMPIGNNVQLNGASGEITKLWALHWKSFLL